MKIAGSANMIGSFFILKEAKANGLNTWRVYTIMLSIK